MAQWWNYCLVVLGRGRSLKIERRLVLRLVRGGVRGGVRGVQDGVLHVEDDVCQRTHRWSVHALVIRWDALARGRGRQEQGGRSAPLLQSKCAADLVPITEG